MRRLSVFVWIALLTSLAACGSGELDAAPTTTDPPTTVAAPTTAPVTTEAPSVPTRPVILEPASVDEVQAVVDTARELADLYYGAWPDIEIVLERFADDFYFWDPSDGDFARYTGGSVMRPILAGFAQHYGEVEWQVVETFVSAEGAAVHYMTGGGYWPPWSQEPDDHPPLHLLDLWRFDGGEITEMEVWFAAEALEVLGFGCFALDGCPSVDDLVGGYLEAWSSGDPQRVAARYAENAILTDTLMGIRATGKEQIGALAATRFGSDRITLDLIRVFALTHGPDPATADNPETGPVIAVGIQCRYQDPDGSTRVILTTFEIGTRLRRGFDLHPDGLITREDVFHLPGPLLGDPGS